MIQQIEEHITKVDAFTASTLDDVEKFRIEYLGKKGVLKIGRASCRERV